MNALVLILGILLLIGGLPLVWKFAKGAARLILSVVIFLISIGIIWYGITLLATIV